jgi:hypothetical protein
MRDVPLEIRRFLMLRELRGKTLVFVLLLLAATRVRSQELYRLAVGGGECTSGGLVELDLTLTNTQPVQGIVAVIQWDEEAMQGVELRTGALLEAADLVVTRSEALFMVLGVVVDTDGSPDASLPVGEDRVLATARLRCSEFVSESSPTRVEFTNDGQGFSAVRGGPELDNLVTVAGRSIERQQGLELEGGTVLRIERPPVSYRIEPTAADAAGCGTAVVLLDHPDVDIEGYEISLVHPPELRLDSVTIAGTRAESAGADFAQEEIFENGGTLGVVLDLFPPFDGNVIGAGLGQSIAKYSYCCRVPPASGEHSHQLEFRAGFGVPPKENAVVVDGRLVPVESSPGTFTCTATGGEICDNGSDDDSDGLVDCNDEDCTESELCEIAHQTVVCGDAELAGDGLPFTPQAGLGTSVSVCLFYKSPDLQGSGTLDQVQGFQIAMCYPCELSSREVFDIAGTIVEAVGAEFISLQADNRSDDGDGCELVLGMLVDALPPFDGATLPPTTALLRLGCMTFDVLETAPVCGTCLPVQFCDGANGRGIVPIRNLVSVDNFSRPVRLVDCEVCVDGPEVFHRGDCNFSNRGAFSVDVSDAAALISHLFLKGALQFQPPCKDACDCNDDGRLDLADAMCVLGFLFSFEEFPSAPGPGFERGGRAVPPGIDPTPDPLDCVSGATCP